MMAIMLEIETAPRLYYLSRTDPVNGVRLERWSALASNIGSADSFWFVLRVFEYNGSTCQHLRSLTDLRPT